MAKRKKYIEKLEDSDNVLGEMKTVAVYNIMLDKVKQQLLNKLNITDK